MKFKNNIIYDSIKKLNVTMIFKELQLLYIENYKKNKKNHWKKPEDLNKWKHIPCSWI